MPHGLAVALVPVAVGLVVLSAIVPGLLRPQAPTLVAGPRPRSTATLSIEKPSHGQVVTRNVLPVVLRLTGGTIVTASSTTLRPDQGHIHISLDGRLISMTYGTLQTIDLSGVKPGVHQIEAEYVASDHGPFNPRVAAAVSFKVAGEGGAG